MGDGLPARDDDPLILRAYLANRTTDELAHTLRHLAEDNRLESMPAKFRYVMLEAASRLANSK